jgi:hypothetical protein
LKIGQFKISGYPQSWTVEALDSGEGGAPPGGGKVAQSAFRVTVPESAPVSQPYWLAQPRVGDYFETTAGPWIGAPRSPPLLRVEYSLELAGGTVLSDTTDVVYLYTDRVYGEREKPLVVVPTIGVRLDPAVLVFPEGEQSTRQVLVRARNNSAVEQRGTIRLELPSGWTARPARHELLLKEKGEELSARFELSPPAAAPSASKAARLKAVTEVAGRQYSSDYQIIDYPHIVPQYWFQPSQASLLQLKGRVAPGLKVGYVMGSGDSVPLALEQLGVQGTLLGPADLAFGDLSQYDAIITGVRAYEVRKELSANHARLMDYVSGGGVIIVQYSRPGGFSEPLGPYPLRLGSQPRVAVEESPVELLERSHPLFHFPNEITPADFAGWVQERGTYFMETWDPHYTPLLESHDPGEPPQKGGMLVASYGKGLYVYTGYAWFRQLPAGVPGAYRIFANMISLGKAPRP